jgi:formylglycine-generating enzyme required for sulfatase activity
MNDRDATKCPGCGEAVQPGWKICPMCETRLQPLVCPGCGLEVKPEWKRCPACEARLICPQCSRRLPGGREACPVCGEERGSAAAPDRFVEKVAGLEMIWVPGGDFEMGDETGDGAENEQPVHRVTLEGFYMGRHAVTQRQWQRLMPENPSRFQGDDRPVEQVTWDDVSEFIRLLNQAHAGRLRFDLPTEAQWEYAARSGGKMEAYAGGDEIDKLAWYEENSGGRTHPVGRKAANGLGLYDMSGNVWEWCRDTFAAEAYAHHAVADPVVTADGTDRVIRGGSWNLDAWSARCCRRFSFRADLFGGGLGFRLVGIMLSDAAPDDIR